MQMTIATLDDYISATKTNVLYWKGASKTSVAYMPYTIFDLGSGTPQAGVLSPGNTANGLVPTDATEGYPVLPSLSGTGYISRIVYSCNVIGNLAIYDKLFHCGAYSYNSEITLGSQPSYSGRLPGGSYANLELWYEQVTAATGTQSVEVGYLDQDGNTGNTGVFSIGATFAQGRMIRIPLASGDTGVQQITHVHGTVASAGTFNIAVMRKLWEGRISYTYEYKLDDMLKTGLPQIYADSALYIVTYPDSTSTPLPYFSIEIADK